MSRMTIDRTLEVRETYLHWLEAQLRDENSPTGEYWGLVNLMFDREFTWSVPHDDNRIADALELRNEFCNETRFRRSQIDRIAPSCSFLEVLIGLSRRLEFIAGGNPPGWAWVLLTNLELDKMVDPLSPRKIDKINFIMDIVIHREYAPDGMGGFFPLAFPDDDQTRIELWYQMNSFVEELHPEH
jgi:hypothetical protein